MMMVFLVFGTAILFARFVSRALPKGGWFFALTTVLTAVVSVIAGFGYGVLLAYLGPGGDYIPFQDYLRSGISNGVLAAVLSPALVWWARKEVPHPVNTKLFDPYRGLPTYDKFGNPK